MAEATGIRAERRGWIANWPVRYWLALGWVVFSIVALLSANRLGDQWAPPAAYILQCTVLLAAVSACVWRAMVDRRGYSEGWLALALALACYLIPVIFLTVMGFLNLQNVDALFVLVLMVLYGVPITFVLASPANNPWRVRVIDALAAITLGGLFFVFISKLMLPNDQLDDAGAMTVEAMFDVQNIYLALFAMVRFAASRVSSDRTFFGALVLFTVANGVCNSICNRIVRLLPFNTDLNIFYELPGLGLTALAICFYLPARFPAGRDRLARVVLVGIPFVLPLSILTLSIALALYDVMTAIAGCAAALVLFGLRMVLAQLHSLDERDSYAELSQYDALTGLPNRRQFDIAFRGEVSRAGRSRSGLALLMIDIDHFKLLNDGLGHRVGDQRLRDVAQALRSHASRASDLVARYGGEEFVAVLPGLSAADACVMAEQMRASVEALALPSPSGRVTVSIGVAWASETATADGEQLIEEADQALYRSKAAGRNRVTAAWTKD